MIDIRVVNGQELFESCIDENHQMTSEPFKSLKYFKCSEFEKETHIVAYDGDRLVGNVALQISPYAPRTMWMMQIAVLPDMQGKGIARQLIDKCMSFVGNMGFCIEISSFSDEGDLKIRRIFEEKALEYNVKTSYNN